MDLQMDVSGLVEKLEKLRAEVVGNGARRALRAGGEVLKRSIVERAPVLAVDLPTSSALPPGAIRDGVRVFVHVDDSDSQVEALVGPSAKTSHVARFVEFGHRQVTGTKFGSSRSRRSKHGQVFGRDVPAHPFLRPAFEQAYEGILEAERDSIAETIQQAVK